MRVCCVFMCASMHFQIEDIRSSIDKIDENVAEVKKLYSIILSAPTSDQGKNYQHPELFIGFSFSSALIDDVFMCCVSLETKQQFTEFPVYLLSVVCCFV